MTEPRARFRHGGTTPPIGWVYALDHEGETYTFQSPMRTGLMGQLRSWYAEKELDWPGDDEMRARVEDFICARVGRGFCTGETTHERVPFLSVSRIRDASRLLLTGLFKGENTLVPPEEAERRAKICANCPLNLHGICTSCAGNEFQDVFRHLVTRGRTTKYDSVLDTCAECGCLLKAKVHVGLTTLEKLEKHTYPKNCWLYGTGAHKAAEKEDRES